MSGMKSWSTTPANNVLANTGFSMDEGMAPSAVNDSVRQLMADARAEHYHGANIASGSSIDLAAATGNYVHITGTTTITAMGTVSAGIRRTLIFDGVLTITHNGTSLICPGATDIATAAGTTVEVVSEGSGNWRVVSVQSNATWFPIVVNWPDSTGPGTQCATPLPFPCIFRKVSLSFSNASTSGTVQVEKLTGTTVPGSGTSLLTGTMSCSGTINTVVNGTLVATVATVSFAAGDRVRVVNAGVFTNLVGCAITLWFQPI